MQVEKAGTLDAVMMTWDLALHGDVTYSTRCVCVCVYACGGVSLCVFGTVKGGGGRWRVRDQGRVQGTRVS